MEDIGRSLESSRYGCTTLCKLEDNGAESGVQKSVEFGGRLPAVAPLFFNSINGDPTTD